MSTQGMSFENVARGEALAMLIKGNRRYLDEAISPLDYSPRAGGRGRDG